MNKSGAKKRGLKNKAAGSSPLMIALVTGSVDYNPADLADTSQLAH